MDYSKYPRTQKFLSEHPGWTIDDAIVYLEKECERRGIP